MLTPGGFRRGEFLHVVEKLLELELAGHGRSKGADDSAAVAARLVRQVTLSEGRLSPMLTAADEGRGKELVGPRGEHTGERFDGHRASGGGE